MRRRPAGRGSYKSFRKQAAKTPAVNLRRSPMRGGIRL